MKTKLRAIYTLFTAALLLVSCNRADESSLGGPADLLIPQTRAASIEGFARYLLIEVNDVNPLNAGEYYLSDGTPFFTHVVIFAANIRGDASGNAHAYNNPNVADLLADPDKYIRPLQAKGIKVLISYLGDHTGLGFSNLTESQSEEFTDAVIATGNAAGVDGYNFDDEWAQYGTRGYPAANSTSFSKIILKMRSKTDKIITVLDWDYTRTLTSEAADCIDLAHSGQLNGYVTKPSFPIPVSRYLAYSINLVSPQPAAFVKARTTQSINAGVGGVGFYNLPMEPKRLATFNAVAQAFEMTCTHTGVTYPKDFGH